MGLKGEQQAQEETCTPPSFNRVLHNNKKKKKWTVKLFHHQLEKLQLNLVKFSPNFEFDD